MVNKMSKRTRKRKLPSQMVLSRMKRMTKINKKRKRLQKRRKRIRRRTKRRLKMIKRKMSRRSRPRPSKLLLTKIKRKKPLN